MIRASLFSVVFAIGATAAAAASPPSTSPPAPTQVRIVSANAAARIGADRAPLPLQGIRGPRVSPDGTRIIFAAIGDLWTVSLDAKTMASGKPPRGQHLMKDAFLDYDPAWSADGTQLAFVSDRGGKPDIWLRDMKNGKLRQLTTTDEAVEGPAWSPDGKRIAFFKIPRIGDPTVRSLSVATVFTGDVADIREQLHSAPTVTWSPDGRTLALKVKQEADRDAKFLLISLAGAAADRTLVPDGGLAPDLARGDGPAWSPDGTKLAYVNDGVLSVIAMHASDARIPTNAGPARRIATGSADSPSWTGDSTTLVYVAADRLKRTTLDGATKDVQPDLSWSRDIADGRLVVWAGRIWDGIGAGYRHDVDIVIDGATITGIEPHTQRDPNVRVINASHDTVIPGLIESEARMSASFGGRMGRVWLAYGVTSVREWTDDVYDALERREAWASGRRYGPRAFILRLAGGAPNPAAIEDAQRLGYDLAVTDGKADSPLPPVALGIPQQAGATAFAMPQLAAHSGFAVTAARDPQFLANPQWAALYGDDERDALTAWLTQQKGDIPLSEQRIVAAQSTLKAFIAGGGHMIIGSDAPTVPYGLGYLAECALAQASGLSGLQVLRSATTEAAAALGADKQIGTLAAGKLADLAIVDGDPLSRVSDLAHISGVVANGHYYIINELVRR